MHIYVLVHTWKCYIIDVAFFISDWLWWSAWYRDLYRWMWHDLWQWQHVSEHFSSYHSRRTWLHLAHLQLVCLLFSLWQWTRVKGGILHLTRWQSSWGNTLWCGEEASNHATLLDWVMWQLPMAGWWLEPGTSWECTGRVPLFIGEYANIACAVYFR